MLLPMLDKLKGFFAGNDRGSPRMGAVRPDEQVAVCAVLLEVAEADRDFDPAERAMIVALLGERFALDAAEVEALIALTQAERSKSPDLWPFTTTIARSYTEAEKLPLLVMVWQVIFADQRLDPHEEHLARLLQGMLSVNHSVLMEAKRQARELAASG